MEANQDTVNQERLRDIKVQLNELRVEIDVYKANIQSTTYLINAFKEIAILNIHIKSRNNRL
jgi:hypothetical protein